ncbi:hypothetical protein BV25DRAFT_335271 [Artomyces pyxidatus]|uniref:Uncharacterized protein n=1 Tax=Artomyces pyxidatus TaxID=48021 RepID=A0ACB8T7D6_9AGAM|nr:hypothetical protein BV25DRAFT_335271 [Artomyces pyxidatus]
MQRAVGELDAMTVEENEDEFPQRLSERATTVDEEVQTTVDVEYTNLGRRCTELELDAQQNERLLQEQQAQEAVLRTLVEESRRFSDELEASFTDLLSCRDEFIGDLREKTSELIISDANSRQRQDELEQSLREAQDKLVTADIEMMDMRVQLEGAERNAAASTNRIVQLEADYTRTRKQLVAAEDQLVDLGEEFRIATHRVAQLEEKAEELRTQLAATDSLVLDLRQELDVARKFPQRKDRPTTFEQSVQTDDDLDFDSSSDTDGSLITLFVGSDSPLDLGKDAVDGEPSDTWADDDTLSLSMPYGPPDPTSVRSLQHRLESMTLKYEAAEAARICGDDIEEMLREKSKRM